MTADCIGGVWSYCIELARALEGAGVSICLATMGRPLSPAQAIEAASVWNLEVVESSWKLEWMDDPWTDVQRAGEWLLDLERSFGPDLIHLNGYTHGVLPFNAPKLVVGHSCVLSWWECVKGCSAPDNWNAYRTQVAEGLAAADMVVAPSQTMLDSLNRLYGPFRNSRVIHNSRTVNRRSQNAAKERCILSAGRLWDDAKNIRALTAIAPELSWPVYVAGDCKEPGSQTSSKPLEGVSLLGTLSCDELAIWYAKSPIYALPARYEPFGLTILEAALANCALVLGDIPSLRELWEDAALFVSPNDPEHLKQAIEFLVNDESARTDYSLRAKERSARYSCERMGQCYLAAYSSLLENKQHLQTEFAECR